MLKTLDQRREDTPQHPSSTSLDKFLLGVGAFERLRFLSEGVGEQL